MRSFPYLLLIIVATFGSNVWAQRGASINFDLRSGIPESSETSGAVRSRIAENGSRSALPASVSQIEQQIFERLNSERSSRGLAPLVWNDEVAAVARLHSVNMATEKFFSHRGSDGSMVDDRADRLHLGVWKAIGENIAYMRGFDDPAATAVEKWLESMAHRKNLLGTNWQETAVGVAVTADGTYYMTQVFLYRK